MKKTIIVVGALLLAFLLFKYMTFDPDNVNMMEHKAEVQIDEKVLDTKEKLAQGSPRDITQEVDAHISQKEPILDCHTRYQKHPNWQEISDIFESFYLSTGEMMGEHHYQQMPLGAVKSYADAGDADAMFHYGSELIWKGGLGIYFNELNRTEVLTQEERLEKVNKHQLDRIMLEQGQQYLIDSAVRGKLGGLIELQLLSHHILKRQMARESNLENTKQALMLSMAYEALLMQIFINDAEVMQDFLFVDDREELIQEFLKNHPQQEFEFIEQEANTIKERLFGYWQDKREGLGLPIYPDKFPPHLEQHIRDKKSNCGS